MSDPAAITSVMAAASQSLRDTAKWLVGGVVATAAGVFAGSSLTAFGSLDPAKDLSRLLLAIAGLLLGFTGLALILVHSVQVLTRESMTFREIAMSEEAETSELGKLRAQLLQRYKDRLPNGKTTFKDYVLLIDETLKGDPNTPDAQRLLAGAKEDNAIITADAGFLFVRSRFQILITVLWIATPCAITGFGLFAWAANPPRSSPVPPAFSLVIQGSTH